MPPHSQAKPNSPLLQDPEHEHLTPWCTFDNCAQCDCDEEPLKHCRHCYHCFGCSSAVWFGCRVCPYSPDTSVYPSWVVGKRRDGDGPRGGHGFLEPPELLIYPNTPVLPPSGSNADSGAESTTQVVQDNDGKTGSKQQGESNTPPGSPPQ
jgi:hypothetical protein